MDFAPTYLLGRLRYAIAGFFHHWYVDGSRAFGRKFMLTLTAADQAFAIKITLRYFFQPLYKDYSIVGRVVGVVFRTGRIIAGGIVYALIVVAFAIVYLAWLAIPVAILWYVITGII